MQYENNSSDIPLSESNEQIIKKLSALWAFNEAVLGGMLHGLHIPFTGLFVGGFAVVLIALIAYFSNERKDIVKAFAIVITAKFILSPHTPVNAYLSVLFQTAAALLLFNKKKHFALSSFLFGIITLTFSALQRVIVYTLLFGFTLWESLDAFYVFLLKELNIHNSELVSISISKIIIILYAGLHIVAGGLIGFFAGRFPEKLKNYDAKETAHVPQKTESETNLEPEENFKKSGFIKKFAMKILIVFSVTALILTYVYPDKFAVPHKQIILMLVRFALLIFLWYFLLMPLIKNKIQNYANKTRSKYAGELNQLFNDISDIKKIVILSWKESERLSFFKRLDYFVTSVFTRFLFGNEKNNNL